MNKLLAALIAAAFVTTGAFANQPAKDAKQAAPAASAAKKDAAAKKEEKKEAKKEEAKK